MGVRLSTEIISPLEPDDRDLLTGLSTLTLAIANHELAMDHFPGVFPDDEELTPSPGDGPEPLPCGATNERAQDRDEGIQRLLEEAKRRGKEEPGSITILVPSKRG